MDASNIFDSSENLFSYRGNPNDQLYKKSIRKKSYRIIDLLFKFCIIVVFQSVFVISDTMIKAVVLYLQIDLHLILLRTHSIESRNEGKINKRIIERTIDKSHIRHRLPVIYRHDLQCPSLLSAPHQLWHIYEVY